MEHVFNLLSDEAKETVDDGKACLCQQVCLELLALLTNPNVCKLLPEYLHDQIGSTLLKMSHFFENIDDGACCYAYDFYEVKRGKWDNKERLISLYESYEAALSQERIRKGAL